MQINLYDFDGVLASPFEEALFTLPPMEDDDAFVTVTSAAFEIHLDQESRQSARYVCIQAAMDHMGYNIEAGPIFHKVYDPYYIITARCDRFAIRRMHRFVDMNRMRPVKIMHVDHLPKGLMIQTLLDRHPDHTFEFWDDNPRHIESALSLKSDRLIVNHVDNDMRNAYTEAESFYRDRLLPYMLS